jgi:hypothetical protein
LFSSLNCRDPFEKNPKWVQENNLYLSFTEFANTCWCFVEYVHVSDKVDSRQSKNCGQAYVFVCAEHLTRVFFFCTIFQTFFL